MCIEEYCFFYLIRRNKHLGNFYCHGDPIETQKLLCASVCAGSRVEQEKKTELGEFPSVQITFSPRRPSRNVLIHLAPEGAHS